MVHESMEREWKARPDIPAPAPWADPYRWERWQESAREENIGAKMCKDVQRCAKMCKDVQRCAKMCKATLLPSKT